MNVDINARSIAILKPNLPCLDWLHTLPEPAFQDYSLDDLRQDCTAVLIPLFESVAQAQLWVFSKYRELFEMELEGWCPDKELWPHNNTLALFKAWFEVEIHTAIVDIGDHRSPAEATAH